MARRESLPGLRGSLVCPLLILSSIAWSAVASAQGNKLVIFAAASLKDALEEVNAAYLRDKGQETTTSYAASPTLAKQIEAAAPADIFISADLDWMDYLAKKNLIQLETRANLLGNQLVLIAPANSTIQLGIAPNFSRLPKRSAMGGSRSPIRAEYQPENTVRRHWKRSASGLRSPTSWPPPRMSGRPYSLSRAARPRSALCIKPMPSPIRGSKYLAPSRTTHTRRSSTPSRR